VDTRDHPSIGRYRSSVSESSVPLLIYDGDCSFCTTSADWVAARWHGRARAVPWQILGTDELAAHALTREDVRSAAWWIDQRRHPSRGHVAIAHALAAGSGWSATVGHVLLVPPIRWIAAAIYPLIARFRHRLPGETPACQLGQTRPDAES
jgi:predicted DCC family thiol-disulfide oxidoreductase YuxK